MLSAKIRIDNIYEEENKNMFISLQSTINAHTDIIICIICTFVLFVLWGLDVRLRTI